MILLALKTMISMPVSMLMLIFIVVEKDQPWSDWLKKN